MTIKKVGNGAKQRTKRYRENLSVRGITLFQVAAPESARGLFREAAELMTREEDPLAPDAAFRKVGGANDPGMDAMAEELAAIRLKSQVAIARALALEAERDTAKAAEAEGRAKIKAVTLEAEKAATVAREAQKRATVALRRAEKAESAIRQARTMPGIKGRLVRWLAGDVLPD